MQRKFLTPLLMTAVMALTMVGCASSQDTGDEPWRQPESREHDRPADDSKDMSKGAPAGMTRAVTAFPTGKVEGSGLLITKTAPKSVQVNQKYQYTIQAKNLTDITLQDVVVQDQMPNTYNLDSAEPRAEVQKGMFTWNLGKLAPGASKTITVTGAATEPGMLTHCAMGTYSLAACVTTMVNQPAIQIVKTGPEQVLQCDPIPYTITVTNTGTGPATGVVINDTMQDGMTTRDGQSSARIEVGTLEAGKSKTVTVQARASKTGEFTNNVTASANGGLEAKASATTTVLKPVLELAKEGPDRIFLEKTFTYTLTVKNTGDGVAANTVVTDNIPNGTSFVSASNNGRMADGAVTWNLGSLNPGQEREVSVTLRAESRGNASARATANADCASAVAATAATSIEGIPAILLEVVDENDPVAVGNEEVYTITVTNQGSAVGTGITLNCTLEDEMQFVGGSGATRVTSDDKTVTFAPVESLEPKAKATWKVRVKANATGDVRFKVSMTSDQIERPVEETESTNFYE